MRGEELELWKKWRGKLLIIYYFSSFYSGMLYSIYKATEYLYIKEILNGPNPIFWFSLIVGLSKSNSVISALAGSIYYDFTLNIRKLGLISVAIVFVGNVLYVLPYSVWLILFGMVLVATSAAAVAGNTLTKFLLIQYQFC